MVSKLQRVFWLGLSPPTVYYMEGMGSVTFSLNAANQIAHLKKPKKTSKNNRGLHGVEVRTDRGTEATTSRHRVPTN
jgi:hypothetical protein